jgi:hypothetical protein
MRTILSGGNAAHKIVYMYREGKDDTMMIKGDEGYIIRLFFRARKILVLSTNYSEGD